MTVRGCMIQNLGKNFKVVASDGYIFFKGRATRDIIDMLHDKQWMKEDVASVEYGRSHDAEGVRSTIVVTIE